MTAALYFDRLPGDELADSLERLQRLATGKRLLCHRCANPITHPAARISVSGSHQHRFTNPNGQTFAIGCFAKAPGCSLEGRAWSEHSWFPGYRWRVALCARCSNHLGWRFQADDRFFGLILDQLRPAG